MLFMKKHRLVNVTRECLSVIILFTVGCNSSVTLEPGTAAPDFALQAVRGGSFQLAQHIGQVVLLSFINTQAEASAATADPSRAQIVFLKSMQEQYGSKGLIVLIVDAARIATGEQPSQDQLINSTYDWQLEDIPVLEDTDSSVAASYAVTSTPVTFLIGADRVIQQRWDGFASASQLALSIEALVGAPAHRPEKTSESPATLSATACPDEVQPQARFAGVGLARPLSEELWVVDGGQSWGVGAAFPIQWILLDTKNLTQQAPMHIQAIGQYTDRQQIFPLFDGAMELLATDIASGLLSGDAEPPTVYSLVTTVSLERAGCLEIQAVVTREGDSIPLYQGSVIISAR
jgi:peroxiredoxin